jgi:hypothetical protein
VFTDGRQPNHNTTTNYVYWRTTTTINPIIIRPHRSSVNTICGLNMIGLSLSSVSKHNMWSYYDYDHILCLLTDDKNDNPIIKRPHIVFTDGRQQRQPIWLGCRCCRPSVNTICGRIMIGFSLLSSVSKHNMWSSFITKSRGLSILVRYRHHSL